MCAKNGPRIFKIRLEVGHGCASDCRQACQTGLRGLSKCRTSDAIFEPSPGPTAHELDVAVVGTSFGFLPFADGDRAQLSVEGGFLILRLAWGIWGRGLFMS
jgi:hypothetical protein